MKPIGDKLIVKHAKVAEKTKSGIFLPEVNKDKFVKAEVISLGGNVPDSINPGDTILYDKHAGLPLDDLEKGTVMIRYIDVIPAEIGNFLMNKK